MILFFDTETTGLPKNWSAPTTDLNNWPRLVQLAYLIYDYDGNLILSSNEIILPDGFTIPKEASNIHGITAEIANYRGREIGVVFETFLIHLKRAEVLVAHNMAYDEKIIGAELIRLGEENIVGNKKRICTMTSTVDLCKIDGPHGHKWPKLAELHRYLFNHDFEGAHDALIDIEATAKCFWELVSIGIIKNVSTKNSKLDQNKNFDVPFLTIDNDGKLFRKLYNTKLDITHSKKENEDTSSVMNSRNTEDTDLWNELYILKDIMHPEDQEIIEKDFFKNEWQDWQIKFNDKLFYKDKFVLDLKKLFSVIIEDVNYKIRLIKFQNIEGYKLYSAKNDISKVVAHYVKYEYQLFGERTGNISQEYYLTAFYMHQNGKVFVENNRKEFDPISCVPFLKIDKTGNTSWQFYDYQKKIFFGKVFEDHYDVECGIKEIVETPNDIWETAYTPKHTGHLLHLDSWKGWTTNDDGDLFFNEKYKLNIFELNLNFPFVDGGPIIRFFDSNTKISKLIAYCQDGDYMGEGYVSIVDWYTTLFYIDDDGKIYLEDKSPSKEPFNIVDAIEAVAEWEAEQNFQDRDIDMYPDDYEP